MAKAHPKRCAEIENFLVSASIKVTKEEISERCQVLDEALTHSSAGLEVNYEKLEFLGDAVLRLAASEFLAKHHPMLTVGQSSALRAQIVSDRWLAELGEQVGIEKILRIGVVSSGDFSAQQTLRAEACEALIGALYRLWGSITPIVQWLTPHWEKTVIEFDADPYLHNWKSGLQEWSQGHKRGLPDYQCQEVSQIHADPRRFYCQVSLGEQVLGDGWGRSRRQAEQEAARSALKQIRPARES